jgi:hypothetical protein
MDTPVTVAIISAAAAAIVAPAISFYLTKSKDRQADWLRYKFEFYKEFILSLSGVVGADPSPEDRRRYAAAVNTLHLIASKGVIEALHKMQDCLSERKASEPITSGGGLADLLLSRLEWEMRIALQSPRNPPVGEFDARLWTPGGASETRK